MTPQPQQSAARPPLLSLPVRVFQGLRALVAFARTVRNPEELDRIFALADAVGPDAQAEAEARQIPAVAAFLDAPFQQGVVDLDRCRACPPGSLGAEVARLLDGIEGDPEVLDRPVQTHALARLQRHVEETHDVWHAVTGFGTTPAAEVGLQAFYVAQIEAPPSLWIVLVGLVRAATLDRALMVPMLEAVSQGWRRGRQARALFGVDWRPLLSRPLAEVRAELGVAPVTGALAQLHTETEVALQVAEPAPLPVAA